MKTKWLSYSTSLVKKHFPESEHILIDGTKNWWVVWFDWLKVLPHKSQKYFIHLDEDAFITNPDEILKLVNYMDKNNYSLSGIPDGGHDYRGANPISINPFFMVGNIADITKSWNWNIDNKFDTDWIEKYKSEYTTALIKEDYIQFVDFCQMPWEGDIFYPFVWSVLSNGFKIKYLYPNFNSTYKSTDPSINKGDAPFLHHMWFTRLWNTPEHIERYNLIEEKIKIKLL